MSWFDRFADFVMLRVQKQFGKEVREEIQEALGLRRATKGTKKGKK